MRYCQAQALVKSLTEDEYFSVQPPAVRKLVRDRILEDVKGRMLEDIVLLETPRTRLFPHTVLTTLDREERFWYDSFSI